MSSIVKMDHRLSNMIAAGEVVERPSSVVKELVENALDAKATKIDIQIFGFGMDKIIVTDNGEGMDKIDAKLAFERHATSKIKTEMDLSHIATLGFRGEALAAIASVAKVILKTKKENHLGVEVVYEGGHFISSSDVALNIGTSIEVAELFYNTPARYKYIKSEYTEKYAIIDVFDRLALANPDVSFSLTFDQKLHKETYGRGDYYQLIDQIYGKQMTNGLTVVSHHVSNISLKAYLVSPNIVRSRKKDISIFINKRYIKNYRLSKAVIDGYHSYLMVSKYPIAMIDITMDPSLLDVNVHPQKYEVRFVNESFLAFEIENMIKKALQKQTQPIQDNFAQVVEKKKSVSFDRVSLLLEENNLVFEPNAEEEVENRLPYLEYVGIFSGTYILFQNREGLYFMDQHAAAERIRYEHYFDALGDPAFATKQRLIPYELALSSDELDKLMTFELSLKPYGFLFKDKALIATPTWLREDEIDIAIESMLHMLETNHKISIKTLRDDLAKDVSCKGAIKANQHISRAEVYQLLEDLKACDNPYTCPHGRPTLVKLTHYEIERMFKRII